MDVPLGGPNHVGANVGLATWDERLDATTGATDGHWETGVFHASVRPAEQGSDDAGGGVGGPKPNGKRKPDRPHRRSWMRQTVHQSPTLGGSELAGARSPVAAPRKHGGDGVDTRALGAELAKEQKEVAAAVTGAERRWFRMAQKED